jgi:uncharacterized protein
VPRVARCRHALDEQGWWRSGIARTVKAAEARVFHLRTSGGEHEVDLIIEREDGRVLAVEFKLARDIQGDDVRHLNWLAGQLGDSLIDAVVVNTGEEAYRRPDGIAVVPASLIGS